MYGQVASTHVKHSLGRTPRLLAEESQVLLTDRWMNILTDGQMNILTDGQIDRLIVKDR